ncbi:MAG: formylglycine-generating enzyme family protein, partial [Trichodesmium sp. MAG_R04]|nr:formylglycine-generating enzyme family protein [Trichodesmium sp. MAG_R04]
MTEITDEIIAQNKVERFVSRFEDSYLLLACHVALPLILTPQLVNYLRIEFLKSERVPWIAEADLLLSNLCRQVGYELYVMDKGVRAYLLKILAEDPRFGKKRIKEIARLLLSYVRYLHKTNPFLGEKELQLQRWGAILYLDTEQTVKEIAVAISKCIEPEELARLLKITQDFKEQIASSGQFQDFLDYAQLCNELLREPEKVKPEQITDSYQVAELELTIPRIANSKELEKGELFSFEVVKVNNSGDIIARSEGSARQKTELLDNEIKLEMVYIPGGTFTMGSPESEKDSDDRERPQHDVTVPPFFMGKYPVTQGQWRAIASRTDLKVELDLELKPSRFKEPYTSIDLQRPVEQVNWYQAVEFCQRLSKLTERNYRLPSEAEWEYACRAGTTTPFYFGETITGELANYDTSYTYADEAEREYREQTTPVGQFPPNAFGLYDMHGNVREWCVDDWHSDYT